MSWDRKVVAPWKVKINIFRSPRNHCTNNKQHYWPSLFHLFYTIISHNNNQHLQQLKKLRECKMQNGKCHATEQNTNKQSVHRDWLQNKVIENHLQISFQFANWGVKYILWEARVCEEAWEPAESLHGTAALLSRLSECREPEKQLRCHRSTLHISVYWTVPRQHFGLKQIFYEDK